jgi:hypothetical protein
VHHSLLFPLLKLTCSDYAIGSAVPLGFVNYFLVGWLNGDLDKYYVESWQIFITLIVVFNGLSSVCFAGKWKP